VKRCFAVVAETKDTSVPSSFQYPVERHRDLQRRWGRLLRRTAVPHKVCNNTTGLRKIMIVWETLYPGERATELQAVAHPERNRTW